MFLGILSLITAICYSIALIIGACPFDFILPGYGKIIMVGVIFALYVIAIATLASKKGKNENSINAQRADRSKRSALKKCGAVDKENARRKKLKLFQKRSGLSSPSAVLLCADRRCSP